MKGKLLVAFLFGRRAITDIRDDSWIKLIGVYGVQIIPGELT
jgi:hypothetical protein